MKKTLWVSVLVALTCGCSVRVGQLIQVPVLEEQIESHMNASGGRVTVDCPVESREWEVGETFDCIATDVTTGDQQTVVVTMRDSEGNTSWRDGNIERYPD